jgi:hypothetical protein
LIAPEDTGHEHFGVGVTEPSGGIHVRVGIKRQISIGVDGGQAGHLHRRGDHLRRFAGCDIQRFGRGFRKNHEDSGILDLFHDDYPRRFAARGIRHVDE